MIINHNMSSINANRILVNTGVQQTKDMAKMSTGSRIVTSGDDAAGLAVSEKMRTQIRGLNQAVRNINDGIGFIQVAEGYLQGTVDSMQRIRELAIQAANGTYSDQDRLYMQIEVSQMVREVDRIASQGQFNGMNLLTGRFNEADGQVPMRIHMGANMDQFDSVSIGIMTASALGLTGGQGEEGSTGMISVTSVDGANSTIGVIDAALLIVSKQRADLGGYQNRLQMAVKSQMIGSENLQASESQIRDMDMAAGSMDLARDNILMQTGTAMLAQANMKTQAVMRLLS